MRLFPSLATAIIAGLSASSLSAQLVISEVQFKAGDQWIELHNQTKSQIDVSAFSIYHATKTPLKPGDYWWGFPPKSVVPANGFLLIHWGMAIPSTPKKNEIYTGTSSLHFLFGHGFEKLDQKSGALAICSTQDNKLVNSASVFSDWFQWGDKGFKRETIAVNNKPKSLWVKDQFIAAVPNNASLILVPQADSNPTTVGAFLFDITPTPLGLNSDGASVTSEGKSCGAYNPQASLSSDLYPVGGSTAFSIRIHGTRGPAFSEVAFFVFSAVGNVNNPPGFSKCDTLQFLLLAPFPFFTSADPAQNVLTFTLPDGTGNTPIWVQALVASKNVNNDFSMTNRLKITVGK